jgi:hypothetical protein
MKMEQAGDRAWYLMAELAATLPGPVTPVTVT